MYTTASAHRYPLRGGLSDEDVALQRVQREALLDLLLGVLDLDPRTRWSPRQAASHPFITGEPFTGECRPACVLPVCCLCAACVLLPVPAFLARVHTLVCIGMGAWGPQLLPAEGGWPSRVGACVPVVCACLPRYRSCCLLACAGSVGSCAAAWCHVPCAHVLYTGRALQASMPWCRPISCYLCLPPHNCSML
jgi:hypothetical protein